MSDILNAGHPDFASFIRQLEARLTARHGCNNTHELTRELLEFNGFDVEPSLDWLKAEGGCCCDCEIVYNVAPRFLSRDQFPEGWREGSNGEGQI